MSQIKLQYVFGQKQLNCRSHEVVQETKGDVQSIKVVLWAQFKEPWCDTRVQTQAFWDMGR